jgi:hypothetical protein
MRSTDARSAQIGRPDGVTLSFQVSRNSVEPHESSRARNLLAKDDWRVALADEPEPSRPEVALVVCPASASGDAEGLAGTTSGPNRELIWPARELERVLPHSNPGEGVEAASSRDICGVERSHIRFNDSPSEVARSTEVSQPCTGVGVDIVVDGLSVTRHRI